MYACVELLSDFKMQLIKLNLILINNLFEKSLEMLPSKYNIL